MSDALIVGLFLILPCVAGGLLVLFGRSQRKRNTRTGAERECRGGGKESGGRKGGAGQVWGRLVLGNSLVLVFLCSLILLAGESYYRFIYDATDSFGCTKLCKRWVTRHYQLTSQGCRDDVEYAPAIAPNMRRVSFMGDSFTTGHGVKNVEDLFWYRIRNAHPGWEVHDLAVLGRDTGRELTMMTDALSQGYQLDEVVLVYCLNDISDLIPGWTLAMQQLYAEVEQTGWLVRNSYFVNIMYWRYRFQKDANLGNYYQCVQEAYGSALWEQQKERLKAFRDLVESHGGHLTVVTFPFLHALGPDYPYTPVHAQLDAFWRDLNVPHLDLLPVYEGLPSSSLVVNRYDAHPNEYANELAANAMDPFLSRIVSSHPKPAPGEPSHE